MLLFFYSFSNVSLVSISSYFEFVENDYDFDFANFHIVVIPDRCSKCERRERDHEPWWLRAKYNRVHAFQRTERNGLYERIYGVQLDELAKWKKKRYRESYGGKRGRGRGANVGVERRPWHRGDLTVVTVISAPTAHHLGSPWFTTSFDVTFDLCIHLFWVNTGVHRHSRARATGTSRIGHAENKLGQR